MIKYLWIMSLIILLVGCGSGTNNEKVSEAAEEILYKKISPEDAKEMMTEDSLILDVRTKEEFEMGYIVGAVLLPVDQITEGNFQILEDKNQTILIYCRSGNRSAVAAKALIEAGYTKVYDFGGIIDWPFEIVKDN